MRKTFVTLLEQCAGVHLHSQDQKDRQDPKFTRILRNKTGWWQRRRCRCLLYGGLAYLARTPGLGKDSLLVENLFNTFVEILPSRAFIQAFTRELRVGTHFRNVFKV